MSTLKVEIVSIDRVEKHPNADRLDLIGVKGWNVIAGRDDPTMPKYKAGDRVIYVPIDSLLPDALETFLFPENSKIKLSGHRIRTIRLRGAISQGMVVDLSDELLKLYPSLGTKKEGDDVALTLGITKYEPPEPSVRSGMRVGKAARKNNPDFHKYTDIENFKFYPNLFWSTEEVYITEKIHGTSVRYGMLAPVDKNPFKRLFRRWGWLPKYTFHVGSRNVELQSKPRGHKTFYDKNVYMIMAEKLGIDRLLSPGEILFGEIAGDGIQANYTYGCGKGEWILFAYDVMKDGKYLDANEFIGWCDARNIRRVPHLYTGVYEKADLNGLRSGDSTVGGQKVREGIVVKPIKETNQTVVGRKVLKLLNDEYLMKEQTDFH